MRTIRKFNYKYLLTGIASVSFGGWMMVSGNPFPCDSGPSGTLILPAIMDTVPSQVVVPPVIRARVTVPDTVLPSVLVGDTEAVNDAATKRSNEIPISKDTLDAPVDYTAEDSMVLDIPNKRVYLYNQATLKYKDMNLKAGIISMDQSTEMLTARPGAGLDSNGLRLQRPNFEEGQNKFDADSMRYNMKTTKGMILNSYSQQGEMFLNAEKTKKFSQNEFFAYNARFTTCDLDTPHFAFRSKKVVYITDKMAITGYTTLEIEGIRFPIGIPYGIFPLITGAHSGILPPSFTVDQQRGLGLTGFGYYKIISPYLDILAQGDLYSYGSWELDLNPSYYKRYHYKGSLFFSIIDTKLNFKGDPDYSQSTNFSLRWTHAADTKARPGTTFSASVDMATSKYNQYIEGYPAQNYQNQLQSSISYSKSWQGTPFYFSAAATQNEQTTEHLWNISLPNLNFTMNTIYPFQTKDFVGQKKWYQNLGIGYNGSYQTLTYFYDTLAINPAKILDTLQYGAHHTIPIQLSLPPIAKYIQVTPSVSYDETWFSQQMLLSWDNAAVKVDTSIHKGFYTQREMTYGISTSTALYGTFNFGNGTAIRHVMRPTFGLSYEPDLNPGSWYTTKVDTFNDNTDFETFNKYQGGIFGAYSQGTFGGINFGLDNNLEMKVRNNSDTATNAFKKVKLLDGFGFTGSYNLVADSFNLSDISIYARTNFLNKYNITAGATLDPYQVNNLGERINKYVWEGHSFTLGRFQSGFISASATFQSPKAKGEQSAQDSILQERDQGNPQQMDEDQRELDYIQHNPAEFANFSIPWQLSLSYSLSVTRTQNPDFTGFTTTLTQSVTFNGSFNLTPNWKIIGNGVYSLDQNTLQYLQASIARNLHCWQMAINLTPIGYYRSFSITLSPKAGILQDLKVNRSRSFYNGPAY